MEASTHSHTKDSVAFRTRARCRGPPLKPSGDTAEPQLQRRRPKRLQAHTQTTRHSVSRTGGTRAHSSYGYGTDGTEADDNQGNHDESDKQDASTTAQARRQPTPGLSQVSQPAAAPAPTSSDSDVVLVCEVNRRPDDDCVMSGPPNKRLRAAETQGGNAAGKPATGGAKGPRAQKDTDEDLDDDEELRIVGFTGQVVTRDLPHPRPDCAEHRFTPGGPAPCNARHCDQCYCYVCDVKASECEFWGTGARERDHSNASKAHPAWARLRTACRNGDKALVRREHRAEGPLRMAELPPAPPLLLGDCMFPPQLPGLLDMLLHQVHPQRRQRPQQQEQQERQARGLQQPLGQQHLRRPTPTTALRTGAQQVLDLEQPSDADLDIFLQSLGLLLGGVHGQPPGPCHAHQAVGRGGGDGGGSTSTSRSVTGASPPPILQTPSQRPLGPLFILGPPPPPPELVETVLRTLQGHSQLSSMQHAHQHTQQGIPELLGMPPPLLPPWTITGAPPPQQQQHVVPAVHVPPQGYMAAPQHAQHLPPHRQAQHALHHLHPHHQHHRPLYQPQDYQQQRPQYPQPQQQQLPQQQLPQQQLPQQQLPQQQLPQQQPPQQQQQQHYDPVLQYLQQHIQQHPQRMPWDMALPAEPRY